MNIKKIQQLSWLQFKSEEEDSFMNKYTAVIDFLQQLDRYDVSDCTPLINPWDSLWQRWYREDYSAPNHIDLLSTVSHQISDRHIVVKSVVQK